MSGPGKRLPAASVVITGIPVLDRKFKYIAVKVARKACRSALGKGMTIVAREERRRVPRATTPGHSNDKIKTSIRGRQNRQRSTGIVTAKAGIDVGKKRLKSKKARGTIGHLLATGTFPRFRKKARGLFRSMRGTRKGRKVSMATGFVKPNDFIGEAYSASKSQAMAVMIKTADQVIQRESAK